MSFKCMICSLSISVEINYHLLTLKVPNELINDVTKLFQIGGSDKEGATKAQSRESHRHCTDSIFMQQLVWN